MIRPSKLFTEAKKVGYIKLKIVFALVAFWATVSVSNIVMKGFKMNKIC